MCRRRCLCCRVAHALPIRFHGFFPVRIEIGKGFLVLDDLRLDLADTVAVAVQIGLGEQLVKFLDPRFAMEDFGFDFGRLAVREPFLAFGGSLGAGGEASLRVLVPAACPSRSCFDSAVPAAAPASTRRR